MSSSRDGPVPSRIGVRSMITVTYLSPRRVCRQTCSSTPITRTPSNRPGSSIRARLPSARTAVFAVFQATPRPPQRPGRRSDADTRCPSAPTAGPAGRVSPAVQRPSWCPAATHARTRRSGSGVPGPTAWSDASPSVRAPADEPPCLSLHLGTRTAGTTHPCRPLDTPAPHEPAQRAAPPLRGRAHQGGKTWSGQGHQR